MAIKKSWQLLGFFCRYRQGQSVVGAVADTETAAAAFQRIKEKGFAAGIICFYGKGIFGAEHRAKPADVAALRDGKLREKAAGGKLLFFQPDDRIKSVHALCLSFGEIGNALRGGMKQRLKKGAATDARRWRG